MTAKVKEQLVYTGREQRPGNNLRKRFTDLKGRHIAPNRIRSTTETQSLKSPVLFFSSLHIKSDYVFCVVMGDSWHFKEQAGGFLCRPAEREPSP